MLRATDAVGVRAGSGVDVSRWFAFEGAGACGGSECQMSDKEGGDYGDGDTVSI